MNDDFRVLFPVQRPDGLYNVSSCASGSDRLVLTGVTKQTVDYVVAMSRALAEVDSAPVLHAKAARTLNELLDHGTPEITLAAARFVLDLEEIRKVNEANTALRAALGNPYTGANPYSGDSGSQLS